MAYKTFPIVLKDMKILLIGGGEVAFKKAEVLEKNSINFEIISTQFLDKFDTIDAPKKIKSFKIIDIKEYQIIVDATGSKKLMQELLTHKQTTNFLYNCVDVPEVCDFFFSALLEYDSLKIAISSSGASPTLAQSVRDKIARVLPHNLKDLTQKLQHQRSSGKIDKESAKKETLKLLGNVTLVGCGTGDVDLLTLKAYKAILNADVVFVDHLISQEIIDVIPATTQQIFVGKEKGHHSVKQEQINQLLVEYASKGLEVARLKAGDPYIFGRGAEEVQAVVAEGIRVDVIPGISSALAGPLSAGIAPTARGYATNLSIVSAHLAGDKLNTEWIELLNMKNHTTIVLMGLSRAEEIVKEALAHNVDADMPTAIISNASRKDQTEVITTLKELADVAKDAPRPAIIVFGNVVNLAKILPRYV